MLFAQISDLHIKRPGRLAYRKVDTAAHLARCVDKLNRLRPRPDAVVLTGDLVDFGAREEYEHLRALLAPLRIPYYLVMGNHDGRDALREVFPDHAYCASSRFRPIRHTAGVRCACWPWTRTGSAERRRPSVRAAPAVAGGQARRGPCHPHRRGTCIIRHSTAAYATRISSRWTWAMRPRWLESSPRRRTSSG